MVNVFNRLRFLLKKNRLAQAPTPEEPAPEPEPAEPDEIYIVQPGDTLGRIAQQVYGEFRLWPLIFEANRDKISEPGLILVGMELLIPKREQ